CLGIAAGVSARLPRPGIWLVTVKRVMAALMAGSGVYFMTKAVYLFL
ncbi:MAG: hypothetical protein HXX17_16520, partial [Geobacteraceae bacterium]|nr:hypothetical protein [Geobacteraceae bacterium]